MVDGYRQRRRRRCLIKKLPNGADGSTNNCIENRIAPTSRSREKRRAGESIKYAPTHKTNTPCSPPSTRALSCQARGKRQLESYIGQLSQDGHRAPPNHHHPSELKHPPKITPTISRHTKSTQHRPQYNFRTCQITSKARHHRITYLEEGKEGQESRQITNKGEAGHHQISEVANMYCGHDRGCRLARS